MNNPLYKNKISTRNKKEFKETLIQMISPVNINLNVVTSTMDSYCNIYPNGQCAHFFFSICMSISNIVIPFQVHIL